MDNLLNRLCHIAPEILHDKFGCKNCCVDATDVGIAVLNRFGVRSRPVNVRAYATNPTHDSCIAIGVVESGDDLLGGLLGVKTTLSHVAILADHYLVDLSAGQMSRPEQNIVIPDAVYMRGKFKRGFAVGGTYPNGCQLRYEEDRDSRFWQICRVNRAAQSKAENDLMANEIVWRMRKLSAAISA